MCLSSMTKQDLLIRWFVNLLDTERQALLACLRTLRLNLNLFLLALGCDDPDAAAPL